MERVEGDELALLDEHARGEAPLVLVDARTKAPLAERRFTVTQLDATATEIGRAHV